MHLIDISPPLSSTLAVWPGDVPLARVVQMDHARGDAVTLSSIQATVHLGAHADAFSHITPGAPAIDAHALEPYLGPCQVLHVPVSRSQAISVAHLAARIRSPRVLLATGTYPDPTHFNDDFAGLSAAAVEYLHANGAILVGIDTPSVDLFTAEDLPAHRACSRLGLSILEGLVLGHVAEGDYELIALPLRLAGFDGSPVRAVLRTRG